MKIKNIILISLMAIFFAGCKFHMELDNYSNNELITFSSSWCTKQGGNFSAPINFTDDLQLQCLTPDGFNTVLHKNGIDYIMRYNTSNPTPTTFNLY